MHMRNGHRRAWSLLPYLACAVFYIWIATRIEISGFYTSAPDEKMRSLVPLAIAHGNIFPSGYDPEVIPEAGNWSYAFYPQMAAAYLSAGFMAISNALGLG